MSIPVLQSIFPLLSKQGTGDTPPVRISSVSLLSIALGTILCLSAIYSGTGVAKADSVIATIPVGGGPYGIAFDSANGNLYVDSRVSKAVSVISGQTNTVIGNPISLGISPVDIAFDSANGNLYVIGSGIAGGFSGGFVLAISGSTSRIIAIMPVSLAPFGIAFDSANGNLYVTNLDDNTVSVIDGATNTVIGSPIPVSPIGALIGAFDIAFDSTNGNLYVTNDLGNTVSIISGQTNRVVGNPITVGTAPGRIAFDSANGNLYVVNSGDNTVSVISGQTNTVIGSPIKVGNAPDGIAFDSANGNLYVTNENDNTVSVISGQINTVVGSPIPVGLEPDGIVYDSANGNLYVTNTPDNTVSVISTVPQAPLQTTLTSAVDGNNAPVQSGGTTASNSIRFSFTTTGGVPPYSYICTLDGASSSCSSGVTFASLPPGTHQFLVQTADANGIRESAPVFSWTISLPLTPIQATQQLIQLTNSLHLSAATDQALDSQLNAAIQYFQLSIKGGACGHLTGFTTQVQTFLRVGELTQSQASQLLQGAQSVEKTAGC